MSTTVLYRSFGTADRPSGLWRGSIHLAFWPAGVPVLPHNIAPVVAAWENQQGTHRPLTREEVLATIPKPRGSKRRIPVHAIGDPAP